MLKGIPAIIPPVLLKHLAEMGHTDELIIADANFPGHTYGKTVVRMDGHRATDILDAVLQLMPLDTYAAHPAVLMEKQAGDTVETPIWDEFAAILAKHDARGKNCMEFIDKWVFYERAKSSTVVILSGETALYGNILLKKGVL